jgi:hypothetical protein
LWILHKSFTLSKNVVFALFYWLLWLFWIKNLISKKYVAVCCILAVLKKIKKHILLKNLMNDSNIFIEIKKNNNNKKNVCLIKKKKKH